MENCHYIYGWFDLTTNNYFYIGAGKHQKLSKYPRSHVEHFYCKRNPTRAENKRKSLQSNFRIDILADNLDLYERNRIEQLYISVYRTINNSGILYNHTMGGDYNPMFDENIRKKHSEVMQSKEHREKMSIAAFNSEKFKKMADFRKNDEQYKEEQRIKCKKIYSDETFYNNFCKKARSDEYIEKQKTRKEIEWNGQLFKSKKQLARFLGISSQLLNYRLDNNIQLDLIPDKTYRSKPYIRKNKKEGDL